MGQIKCWWQSPRNTKKQSDTSILLDRDNCTRNRMELQFSFCLQQVCGYKVDVEELVYYWAQKHFIFFPPFAQLVTMPEKQMQHFCRLNYAMRVWGTKQCHHQIKFGIFSNFNRLKRVWNLQWDLLEINATSQHLQEIMRCIIWTHDPFAYKVISSYKVTYCLTTCIWHSKCEGISRNGKSFKLCYLISLISTERNH